MQNAGDIDRLFEVEDTAEEEAEAGVWSRDDDRFRCSALLSMAEDAPDLCEACKSCELNVLETCFVAARGGRELLGDERKQLQSEFHHIYRLVAIDGHVHALEVKALAAKERNALASAGEKAPGR